MDSATGDMREVKTLAEVPEGKICVPIYRSVELGELRWIVLKWKSPEDLERMGFFDKSLRYQAVESDMGAEAFLEFQARVASGESPETAFVKVENQADRARPLKVDSEIETFFDPEWRKSGDYHFFFRLERADGSYHPADGEALEGIRLLWESEQTVSPEEYDAERNDALQKQSLLVQARKRAIWSDLIEPRAA
jgi:hypothetical protein